MKLTNFEESEMERANDVHVGEIDKYLEKEAKEEWMSMEFDRSKEETHKHRTLNHGRGGGR